MKWRQVLGVAVFFLCWTGDASEEQQLRRPTRIKMPNSNKPAFGGAGTDAASTGSTSRKLAALQLGESSGQTRGTTRRITDGQPRRVLGGRRPLQRRPGATGMVQNDGALEARARLARMPSGASSPNLLASFAGKNRVLVISAPHESDGYYRLMMSLLKPDVYCELAERHVQQIVMFHQEGEMGGKVRRITSEGKIIEEPLDMALIPRLMNFLKLEKGKFGMVLLRKTLQVEERYPYPVRLEAMYEVIDQAPVRKLEKMRQKGFVQKCRGAGVEGQVMAGHGMGAPSLNPEADAPAERKPEKKERKPIPKPTTTIPPPTTTTTTRTTTTTTTRATTTTARATTTTRQSTTTTAPTTTPTPPKGLNPIFIPSPKATEESYYPNTKSDRRGKHHSKPPLPTTTPAYYHTRSASKYGDNRTDKNDRHASVMPTERKPPKSKPPKKKNHTKMVSNEYDDKLDIGQPTSSHPDESKAETVHPKKGKGRHNKGEKKRKKAEKANKRDKSDKKSKAGNEGKGENRDKNSRRGSRNKDKDDFHKPSKKPHKGSLATFLDYFENQRRLVLITTPHEEHKMYTQQRDEYLEHVCEMAIRKVSIITIFGTFANNTMKIDHYQLEHDKPMKGLKEEDLVNQDLIIELRKEYGMTYDDFCMVLTDLDMKLKQLYEVPIAMKSVFGAIDMFSSRIPEMEKQKREGVMCRKEDKPRSLENFLSRFRWRRRLFIISTPNDEEWAYQQQLYALTSQACNLGLRHVSVWKLVGVDPMDMGGVVELYPINGSATVDREGMSASLVKDIRNYFQISPEYFSMLLVGKDGNVKSWYPSPMWSMAIIYDLIDSMQLRRQEMAIQQSLGMRCPEDEYGGYGFPHHGYHEGYQEGYHQGYSY